MDQTRETLRLFWVSTFISSDAVNHTRSERVYDGWRLHGMQLVDEKSACRKQAAAGTPNCPESVLDDMAAEREWAPATFNRHRATLY
jgi:hypothetical protein